MHNCHYHTMEGRAIIINSSIFTRGRDRIERLGSADIVIALFTRNTVNTVRPLAETLAQGLRKHLGYLKPVIINMDYYSDDGTATEFQRSDIHKTIEFATIPCKDRFEACRTVYKAGLDLSAHCILFFSGSLTSALPSWVSMLAAPVMEQHFHYVGAHFPDTPYQDLYRDFISAPLFGALFGTMFRSPFPRAAALQGSLCEALSETEWSDEGESLKSSLLSVKAVEQKWKAGEVPMEGIIDDPLSRMERDAGASMLVPLIEKTTSLWCRNIPLTPVELCSERRLDALCPPSPDAMMLSARFKEAVRTSEELIGKAFSRSLASFLVDSCRQDLSLQAHAPGRWGELLYQYLQACHLHRELREPLAQLLPSLLCRWLARLLAAGDLIIPGKSADMAGELAGLCHQKRDDFIDFWMSHG